MNEEESKKSFGSIIAFIASIITIFVFVTGISSLGIFPPRPSSTPEPVQTTNIFPPPTSAPATQVPVAEITPAPTSEITPQAIPGKEDMKGCNSDVLVTSENS